MGRPPSSGGPSFRFTQAEVAEMEACLLQLNNAIPQRSVIQALADRFTASAARAGKISVQYKQAGVELVPEPEVLAAVQDHQGPAGTAGEDAAGRGRRAARRLLQGSAICLCALRLPLRCLQNADNSILTCAVCFLSMQFYLRIRTMMMKRFSGVPNLCESCAPYVGVRVPLNVEGLCVGAESFCMAWKGFFCFMQNWQLKCIFLWVF